MAAAVSIDWDGFGRTRGDFGFSLRGGLHVTWDRWAVFYPKPRHWVGWFVDHCRAGQ